MGGESGESVGGESGVSLWVDRGRVRGESVSEGYWMESQG